MNASQWPEYDFFRAKIINSNQGQFLVHAECTERYFFEFFLNRFGYIPAFYFYGIVSDDVFEMIKPSHEASDTYIEE